MLLSLFLLRFEREHRADEAFEWKRAAGADGLNEGRDEPRRDVRKHGRRRASFFSRLLETRLATFDFGRVALAAAGKNQCFPRDERRWRGDAPPSSAHLTARL